MPRSQCSAHFVPSFPLSFSFCLNFVFFSIKTGMMFGTQYRQRIKTNNKNSHKRDAIDGWIDIYAFFCLFIA